MRLLRVVWVSCRTMSLSTPPLVSTSGVTVSNRGIGLTHELAPPPGVLTEYSPVIHDGVLQGDRRM